MNKVINIGVPNKHTKKIYVLKKYDKKLKFLDEINDFVMSVEKKYKNVQLTFDKLNIQKHMLINFKDDDFIDKIKKDEVSVIQFSASWCSPCKVLKPIMEKLSDEFKEKNFYYADIDDDAINTASSMSIRGVPTVVILKKGQEVSRKVGGVPETHMRDFLKENL